MLTVKKDCLKTVLAFTVLLLITLNSYGQKILSFEGKAIDPETSVLLYIENHQVTVNNAGDYLSAHVTYSNPEGEVFAEKTLNYDKNSLAPDMMFYDKRSGERTSVVLNTVDAYLDVLIETKKRREESKVKLDEALIVVDAGFDRLIKSRWGSLRKNKELDFTFLAITRAQLINFEVVEVKASDTSVLLELHPRNFFIDLLVEPIVLEYDINKRHLFSFEGLTNIEIFKDGERTGKNYVARIDYRYHPLK
tara:strand:- start:6373 stop:7122 length:750 start_codon:yes stop_codon:yes gene_type:complete